MKKITIDLSASPLLGTAAKSLWILKGYLKDGFEIDIVAKNWAQDIPVSGMVFDGKENSYNKPSWTQLWDPKLHPKDFFENLVIPSFEKINYQQPNLNNSLLDKLKFAINTLFSPRFITNHDFVMMFMGKKLLKTYRKQKISDICNIKNIGFINTNCSWRCSWRGCFR